MSEQTYREEPTIDFERQKSAKSYARSKRWLFLIELGLGGIYILAFLVSNFSFLLRDIAFSLSSNRIIVVAVYFIVFYFVYTALTFPFSVFGGYVLPQRYGLSTQTFGGWLSDWAKSLAIGVVIAGAGVEIAYYLLEVIPGLWWLIMGVIVLLFTVVLANLGPVLLVPLFYKMVPLENESLAQKLIRLAEKANAKVKGVYRLNLSSKTTAANAALMGLGNTRRIVLGDTLLDRYTEDEIESVFAHELGHHVHSDIVKLITIQSALTLVGLYIASYVLKRFASAPPFTAPSDIASLPLLALTIGVVSLLALPLGNGLSRLFEHQADEYALESTGNPRAFRNAMVRLANQNLAELDPGALVEFWMYDHPAIGKRIALAEHFERKH